MVEISWQVVAAKERRRWHVAVVMSDRAPDRPRALYHERQQFMRCGLHAVNNILQRRAYTARDFECIADDFVRFGPEAGMRHFGNPHCTVLRLGNYDANIVVGALVLAGFDTEWCPNMTRDELAAVADAPSTLGFLVNESVFLSARHWFALRKIDEHGCWGLFDSNRAEPVTYPSLDRIVGMLHSYSCSGERVQLLRVFVASGTSAIDFAQSFCDDPHASTRLLK